MPLGSVIQFYLGLIIFLYVVEIYLIWYNAIRDKRFPIAPQGWTGAWARVGMGLIVPVLVALSAAISTEAHRKRASPSDAHSSQITSDSEERSISDGHRRLDEAAENASAPTGFWFSCILSTLVVTMTLGFVTVLEEDWKTGRHWKGLAIYTAVLDVVSFLAAAGISTSEAGGGQLLPLTILTFCSLVSCALVYVVAHRPEMVGRDFEGGDVEKGKEDE